MRLRTRTLLFACPSWISAGIGLLTLPLTTTLLDPAAYGAYFFVGALGNLVTGIACAPFIYLLAPSWATASDAARSGMLRHACLWASGTALGLAFAVWGLVAMLGGPLLATLGITPAMLLLGLIGAVLGPLWFAAIEVATLENRAGTFFIGSSLQLLGGTIVTLVMLFGFSAGPMALFWGQVASAGLAWLAGLAILGPFLIRREGLAPKDRYLAFLTIRGPGQFFEQAKGPLERLWIGFGAGTHALGLYGHATVYGAFLYGSAGAVQRAARATALSEARAHAHDMPVAAFATRLQQYGLSFAALAMALLGDEAINLLSNGKFGEAYVLAAILILAVLVQTSFFVHDSLALTRYATQASAKIATAAGVVGFVAMIPLVLAYGALGAVIAALVQALFHRFRLVRLIEGRTRPQAHTKQLVIVAGVLGILWVRSLWPVEIEIRLLGLMGLVVLWLYLSGVGRVAAVALGGILARRRRGN